MQALIKKGTDASPVWGSIRFQPNGWVFLPENEKPHIFNDGTTKEGIESLFLPNTDLQHYEMIPVTVIPKVQKGGLIMPPTYFGTSVEGL